MAAANTSSSSSSQVEEMPQIDKDLLKSAMSGDAQSMKAMASRDGTILLGRTPQGNTCLHISSSYGHEGFCKDVVALEESLLVAVNSDRETALIAAVGSGYLLLASFLLRRCLQLGLRQAILQQDINGFNALHHAIRSGLMELALEFIEAEPELSIAVNKSNESPMFIAAMRNFTNVFEKLLDVPNSATTGQYGRHVLHAAAKYGNPAVAERIMEKRPYLAFQADLDGITPIRMAVYYNKVDVLRVLLVHDSSLGYEIDKHGYPLLWTAAARGQVDVARELLKHCPDALYRDVYSYQSTCLHKAILEGHLEFVKFILTTPLLRKLVNMRDTQGKTALHYAVEKCDPKIFWTLLSHHDIDIMMLDNRDNSAASLLPSIAAYDKPLDWKELQMLLSKAYTKDDGISLYNLGAGDRRQVTLDTWKQRKLLSQRYTGNTSLVAILLATITFTAAFTMPGGYSNDSESAGLPVMSRKIAFQAFLVSDSLAMCSSFIVAFICLMGKWEDDKFTSYYNSITKNLTWFAYMTTITAFSTGLYTVLAPQLHWLAITIVFVVALLPIVTKLIGEWPVLKIAFRMGGMLNSDVFYVVRPH